MTLFKSFPPRGREILYMKFYYVYYKEIKNKMNLETKIEQEEDKLSIADRTKDYVAGCLDPKNARLYGNFQERAALNITQFPKIQGSLFLRMGLVYPIMSYLVDKTGLPADSKSEFLSIGINYHTWAAGYLAYLAEIQVGMSKYPIEIISKGIRKVKNYFSKEKK